MIGPTPTGSTVADHDQRLPLVFPGRERLGAALPASLTSFVGREREIREVSSLLRRPDVRLVTLTGPGGVGKTRLALRVAECLEADCPDGVAFVDLTSVATPDLFAPTVAHALGLRAVDDRPIADRLVDLLTDRHLLLMLDNLERVIDAAPMVARLLAGCPRLAVLATSREPLRLSAEWVIIVPPLTLPDLARSADDPVESESVRLFAERARAVRADFVLTAANAGCVHEIVRRLDGLPLAIELAAARLAHLPPPALLQRLDRRLPLLTGGARDLPERQRTLRDAIDWSHDLLTPGERTVFRRLAVFAGGCALEGAEAVGGPDGNSAPDTLDVIASLVAKSLLRQDEDPDGGPRFVMLETVREYGLERLAESGEERSTRDRHAAFFVVQVERADPAIWGGPDHVLWLDRLEAELPNIRAALTWLDETGDGSSLLRLAAALGGLWCYRGLQVEGRAWLIRALETGGEAVPAARAMAYIKLGIIEHGLGGPDPAALVRRGLALRRQLDDQRGIGHALTALGNVLRDGVDDHRAIPPLEEAAVQHETLGNTGGLATTRYLLGMVALGRDDLVRAQTLLSNANTLYRQTGFNHGVANTLLALGQITAERGDVAVAAAHYAESLRLWVEVRSRDGLVAALAATGTLAARCHLADPAARLLGAASRLGDALGYVAPARERDGLARAAATARTAMGPRAFAVAWEAGQAMGTERATAEANEVLALVALATPAPAGRGATTVFTPREHDVLRLLVEGQSDREIAEALGLTYRTVTSYVRNILAKFDVTSRTAAATLAVRRGLV